MELFLKLQLKLPEDIYEMYIYDFFFCIAEQITEITVYCNVNGSIHRQI